MLGEVNANAATVKTNTNESQPSVVALHSGLEEQKRNTTTTTNKRKEKKPVYHSDSIKAVVETKRRQTLLDLLNLERLEQAIKIADTASNAEMSKSSKHQAQQLKNSASLAELNRANEKKIVRQVLKDLIWLYKSESSVNVPAAAPVGKVAAAAAVATTTPTAVPTVSKVTSAATTTTSKKPVEIKIRKENDKLIIKSSEPVIINTSSSDNLEVKKIESSSKQVETTNTTTNAAILSTERTKLTQPRGDLANSIKAQATALDRSDKTTVNFVRRVKYLGIVDTDPEEYRKKYGGELKQASELPEIIKNLKTPNNIRLAADKSSNSIYELVGDLEALRYVDLDAEGLSQYRDYLNRIGILEATSKEVVVSSQKEPDSLLKIVKEIFKTMDRDRDGFVSIHDAERTLLKLNSRCKRNYGEDDLKEFFRRLDTNKDNLLDLEEFKKAFFTVKC